MSDMLIATPVEYVPALLAMSVVIVLVMTYVKAVTAYQDWLKEHLRDGTVTEKVAYAMDYLTADIVSVVTVVAASVVIPGMVYDAFLGGEYSLGGCAVIAMLVAFVGGWGGVEVLHRVVDSFRNRDKIDALVAEAKKPKDEPKQ